MDGYELIKKMHSVDANITAVAFTANVGMDYRQKAMEAGFHSVITKPVHDMDAFCRMIVDLKDRTAA